MKYVVIACRDKDSKIIGDKNGKIPWKCSIDMKHFKNITSAVFNENMKNLLVVGRKTFMNMPETFDLKTRRFFVINYERNKSGGVGNDDGFDQKVKKMGALVYSDNEYNFDMHRLVSAINALANIETVYVIGGECVYSRFLYHDITYDPALIDEIILGEISNWGTCEVCAKFSDWMLNKFTKVKVLDDCNIPLENGTNAKYTLTKYIRSTLHPEHKYINLIENIITNGDRRDQERTGTGTLSLFGQQLTINLTDGYCPVLHTRNMPTGSIVSEYKWYLSGSTNVDDLRKISGKQKTVWDANTSREFLDGVGLSHYSPGDIGPSYGFQFRHAGASYTKKDSNYATAGVDQIQNVIHSLKTNPHGRRHIISLWSVPDIDKMALPPCLRDYQFYIRKTLNSLGKLITVLDCKADQRSSDIFLAGYWNIYQVAYLIYYILEKINVSEAKTTNDNLIYPGRIIMNYGDVHVYTHQLDQCKRQIQLANNHTLEFYNVTSFSEDTGFKFSPEYNPLSKLTSAMAI